MVNAGYFSSKHRFKTAVADRLFVLLIVSGFSGLIGALWGAVFGGVAGLLLTGDYVGLSQVQMLTSSLIFSVFGIIAGGLLGVAVGKLKGNFIGASLIVAVFGVLSGGLWGWSFFDSWLVGITVGVIGGFFLSVAWAVILSDVLRPLLFEKSIFLQSAVVVSVVGAVVASVGAVYANLFYASQGFFSENFVGAFLEGAVLGGAILGSLIGVFLCDVASLLIPVLKVVAFGKK